MNNPFFVESGALYIWSHSGDVLRFKRTGNLGMFLTIEFENLTKNGDLIYLDATDWFEYVRPITKLDKLLSGADNGPKRF